MMLVGSALKGYAVEATDGKVGTVSDFLFDDETWKIRWMVIDTGTWLTGRKVLVHPSAIGRLDGEREELLVKLKKAQAEASPDILTDAPVSRQMENNLYGYYGWDPLWGGGNYFGAYPYGIGSFYQADSDVLEATRPGSAEDTGDPHLRSLTAVTGYHIQAKDGRIGHVENFLVDDADWGIRYLVIDTKNWWAGQHVVMSPYAVRTISWSDRDISLDVTREQVKGSPAWDPLTKLERSDQERLHGYYGWPAYGW
jgi:sporulation protein YlmC with PRC-barrel domain